MAKLEPKISTNAGPAGSGVVPANDYTSYLETSDDQADEGAIVTHGPRKSGKSVMAATASQFWPEKVPAVTETVLSDMCWLSVDEGAVAGFYELGVKVPWIIPVRKIFGKHGVGKGLTIVLKLLTDLVKAHPEIKWIVVDTVSMADRYFNTYYGDIHDKLVAAGERSEKDGWSLPRDVLNAHKRIYSTISFLEVRANYLCHSKSVFESDAKGDKAEKAAKQKKLKDKANRVSNEPIQPDISGAGQTVYMGNASLILPLKSIIKPGSTDNVEDSIERYVLPFGGEGFEGDNRYHQSLSRREPAHLGKLLAKIKTRGVTTSKES